MAEYNGTGFSPVKFTQLNNTDILYIEQNEMLKHIQLGTFKRVYVKYKQLDDNYKPLDVLKALAYLGIDTRHNQPFTEKHGRGMIRLAHSKNNLELFKKSRAKSINPMKIKTIARIIKILASNSSPLLKIRLIADINNIQAHHKNYDKTIDIPSNIIFLMNTKHKEYHKGKHSL